MKALRIRTSWQRQLYERACIEFLGCFADPGWHFPKAGRLAWHWHRSWALSPFFGANVSFLAAPAEFVISLLGALTSYPTFG